MKRTICRLSALVGLLSPVSAWAHPGHMGSGFADGVIHPLTGIDHLATMMLIGVAAALLFGRHAWRVPAMFCGGLVLGFAAAAGMAKGPVELATLASLGLLGLAVALRRSVPIPVALTAAAIFGFAHGAAHGIDMPGDAMPVLFVAGFLVSSVFLHGAGYWIARALPAPALRALGLAGTGLGLVLAVSA